MMAYNYRMSQPVGFQKLAFAPRLTGAALGAGLGAVGAPADEGWTGAALGGLAGYGLGAGADYLTRPFRGASSPVSTPATPAPSSAPVGVPPTSRTSLLQRAFGKLRSKRADYGFSTVIPGVALNYGAKDERLEGMSRWVPRKTIEQAYQGLEAGYDNQALYDEARETGALTHPAIGALLGALATRKLAPTAHWQLPAVGALTGAGLGAAYSQSTAPKRVEDMRQAIRGVSRERAKQPSAREAMPMVMSSSGDDV